jgi:hypothetical protein
MLSPRSVLVEHNAGFRCPTVWVGDEAMICLPDTPRDARVTCVLTGPDGESESVEVRRRESRLFADHAAAAPIHTEGRHHYRFMVDGRQHRGEFVVRPTRKRRP